MTLVFQTAAGFSSASAQYALPDPPFSSYDKWTVAPFSVLKIFTSVACSDLEPVFWCTDFLPVWETVRAQTVAIRERSELRQS
jgi:hypothetical protein